MSEPTGAEQPEKTANANWVLVVAILGSSMAFIDSTVVNVALPALQASFRATGADLQWVVQSYALLLAALLLIGGALGDTYGRRNVFLIGVVIFSVASLWCGLAGSIESVIVARALQGCGAALLVPESLALITAAFPEETRGQAIGTWSAASAVMIAVGPVLGGWLVQHESWRWVFFLNLPLAIVTIVLGIAKVPETRSAEADGALDWLGALLATAGLGAATFALIELPNAFPHDGWIGAFGALLIVAFVFAELRVKNPMMPLELFRSSNFSGANLLTFFLYGGLSAVFYYLPQKLIQINHYSPTKAGAVLIPITVLLALLSRWSGGLATRFGPRLPLVAGPLIVAAGFLMMLRSTAGSYWTALFPGILILGFGLAVTVAPLTALAMNSASGDRAGSASGVNNAVSRIAGVLALAVAGIFFSTRFTHTLFAGLRQSSLPQTVQASIYAQRNQLGDIQTAANAGRSIVDAAFTSSFHLVLLIAAALAVASAATAGWLVRRPAADKLSDVSNAGENA
jgi:EmrB/QacA subfamily drug resistance transporter